MARRDEPAADPTRREFFRTFGRETARSAGTMMGAAAELRRRSGEAARELLDLGQPGGVDARPAPVPDSASEAVGTFNSAYRVSGGSLLILDQRELPTRVSIITCREPSEVASAIRLGAVNCGPVTGELAAYAMALAVAEAAHADRSARDQALRAAANTLRGARRDVRALTAAADRMEARYDELTGTEAAGAIGDALAATMRAEADAIATEAQLANAALGRVGAEILDETSESINLLMHADMGPLSCGMVGAGTQIIQELMEAGHYVHVWVTEGAPSMEGTRLAGYQLTQLDVPHTVIPDTAVSWLLASRRIDAALLRGDTVGATGETLAPIGSRNVAQLATDAGVPVHVVASASAFAPSDVDPKSLLFDLRSPTEALHPAPESTMASPQTVEVRLAPTTDLVPPRLVSGFITETGLRQGGSR